MEVIHKVERVFGGNCFKALLGEVKRVFDTDNVTGALYSVRFEQNGNDIYLPVTPMGNLYYRYKKKRK